MKILYKRLFRNVKKRLAKYILVALILFIGTTVFIAIASSTDSILREIRELEAVSNCEDGYFILHTTLDEKQIQELHQQGVLLEENFYINIKDFDSDISYRFYRMRKEIDLVQVKEGKEPEYSNEVLLEQHFAESQGYKVGNELSLAIKDFKITGIGYSIDYDALYQDGDGPYPDYEKFGLVFVSDEEFEKLANEYPIQICYSYILQNENEGFNQEKLFDWLRNQKKSNKMLDENVFWEKGGISEGESILSSCVKKEDNQRIISFIHDVSINRNCVLPMGLVFFVMIAFLIATLAVTDVREQYSSIGTLYALGYGRNELTCHLISIPVVITALSAFLGTLIGFLCAPFFMKNYVQGGCITNIRTVLPIYLWVYGVIIPIVVSIVVNWSVINRVLAKPIVMLLKNAEYEKRPRINWKLDTFGLKNKFQIRQLMREIILYGLLMISLFLTIFMLIFGVSLYGTLNEFKKDCRKTMKYDYKYLYQYPETIIPAEGEIAYERYFRTYAETVNMDFSVELIGILPESYYFGNAVENCEESDIVISSSVRDKFNWEIGEMVSLTDSISNELRNFYVKDVIDFAYGMYIFTNIEAMQSYYQTGPEYWNVLYTNESIKIPTEQLVVELKKESCIKGAEARINSLMGIILTLSLMGIFVFIGMLFMMINIMMEKWKKSVGILKIMGFSQKEVTRIYLLNSLYIVIINMLISIPASLKIVATIFPHIISTIPNGIRLQYPIELLCMTVVLILGSWLIVYQIMSKRIKEINPLEIIREHDN